MLKADDVFLFVQVVEEGSFSKVANKLEITNSVVSKRIGRLEADLNVQLLYRTTRKLSLTDAGRALYGKARLAKQALQDAQDTVTGYGDTMRGKIKVTAPAVSAQVIVSDAIAQFCQQYPEVEVELVVSNRVMNILDEGYDLAIRTAYLEDSSLIARRLINSDWVICASPAYLNKHGIPTHPTELEEHDCLIYKYEGQGAETWRFIENDTEFNMQVKGRIHSNNLDSLRRGALAGVGIAYLPRVLVCGDLDDGKLVSILSNFVGKKLGVYAVYPRSRQPDKKLNLLVEHLRGCFQNRKEMFY
ncbi:LysR family transcriptional regulator [Psychrobium sp. nBUS_13]|uniref:LysR family transcriptional regulator n=1 Tax=Psychrobium sp. nBUS_13 TaxID=3395319 RepID=UPI003EBA1378